ncbi:MAG TPA: membrane protein insertase YidC [Terriglobales bacterium]|nr:membrane protein insertase YidC [Terriglobales bacterium]
MERRLLLVFALTFLAIILFQPILKKYSGQPPQEEQKPPATVANPPVSPPPSTPQAQQSPGLPANTAKQASSETETVIENDLYRITFTNRGAQIKSWILKQYTDEQGKPLELVNAAAARYGLPLSFFAYDEALRTKLNSALYQASSTGLQKAPQDISFEYADQDLAVTKKFHFDHSYIVDVETSVRNKGADFTAFPVWPAGLGDETTSSTYAASLIAYQYNDKVQRVALKKISSGATVRGPLDWAGIADQYFAAVFIPDDPQNAVLVTLRNNIDIPKDKQQNPQDTFKAEVLGAGVGSLQGPTRERIFVGPKALPVLESVNVPSIQNDHPDLRALVDFGWFGVLARPLFIWLKWMQAFLHNWGWAIILQTVIITMALLPLRISSMKSMLKMQKVAPQIKSIQEKYKKYSMRDPRKQEMQQEISAVYKEHGVNPVGGCLPMLIQMPFLFAYYRMLGVAIDLRHAHWLWIHDLSAPDPLHLLPIGIIITMFLTQRMTPQAGMDPAQQKMMNFMMPVMLGIISWNLAAGLNLYWSVSQLLGIGQQLLMNRSSLGREMREMMEKRARKAKK